MTIADHAVAGKKIRVAPIHPLRPSAQLLRAARQGDLEAVRQTLEDGVPVDSTDLKTGLTALHVAVGTNNLELARFLIEECKASFQRDRFGRWPSLVAAECQVDDDLADYIAEKEDEAVGKQD